MVDNQLVAFIGWDGYGGSNVNVALDRSKIHVGRLQGVRIYSDCRARRNYTHQPGFYKIFKGKVFSDRICKFCLDKYPAFWTKLQTEPPGDQYQEKPPLAEERAVLPHKTCDCIPELKDGDLVTFLGWHYFDYKRRTLATGKIHVGKYRELDESIRSVCQCHPGYNSIYKKGQYKIITAEKNIWRGCKFCRSGYPHLYKRLREAKSRPEMIYQLTYPRKDKDGKLEGGYHVITGGRKTMENVLKGRQDIHEHINSTRGDRVKLFKGSLIEVEFKTRTVVDEVIIKG